MLDDSFLYQEDLDRFRRKLQKHGLNQLYRDLYANGRLLEPDESHSQDLSRFFGNYDRTLWLINELVKDNYQLQHRVDQMRIKNRLRKGLGRYKPPEIVKNYVTPAELDSILDGTFISKNYLPMATFSMKALEQARSLSSASFEVGLRKVQEQISSPKIKNPPLVSIIIPTRDGLHHLKRLFADFDQTTGYSNYELLIVDNGSQDGTRKYLNELKNHLNLRVIYNSKNKSFSESNNTAAKKARGSYLLFLNNDISPTEGWLNHMVSTALKDSGIGAVGAKLVYPFKPGFENSYNIQHGGIGFRLEDNFIRPENLSAGAGFLTRNIGREEEKVAVTAACLLVSKRKFLKAGGFDETYWYGYEDVDLCLKLQSEGYRNVINNAAVLFHYEFGTQHKLDERTVTSYREGNINIFKRKWQKTLYPKYWQSLLSGDGVYTDKKLHIGFVVTEASDKTAAGDYYTAKELGGSLADMNYKVTYIGVKDSSDPYYIDPDVDILISMIDDYDISKIENSKIVKIGWCRNWFDRWAERDYFRDFDLILTSSEIAQELFREKYFVDSHILKLAVNKKRFTQEYSKDELASYESDICFTGSYWQVPRDISKLFDVDKFKERFKIKIFGKGWDSVSVFKPFWQGFLEYKSIPKVYSAGKVLIDDANSATNKWGSVNSRVFDGAASGILVISNGVRGSNKTFNNKLPTFSTKAELSTLLENYLGNEGLRQEKIKEIRGLVLAHHTYEHRANQLIEILKNQLGRETINLNLPMPQWSEAKHWGDLYFGMGLKRGLEKRNFNVKLRILPEWNEPNFAFANITLRGLSVFHPPAHQLNIMWNISHPGDVSVKEYRSYDYVFVASKYHAGNLKHEGLKNVYTLYQCFDDSAFGTKNINKDSHYRSDILFVGNTRNHYRKVVRDILSWKNLDKYNFKVYGKGWGKFIDKRYIAGDFIENNDLKNHYHNTKILLNDHWDDMNKYAFASNRLFDASACGTFIISDSNPGIKEVFGKGIIEEYDKPTSLHRLLEKYLAHPEERRARANKARALVLKNHSFDRRTDQLLDVVKELQK